MSSTEVVVASGIDLLPATGDRSQWSEREAALMDSLGLRGTKNQKRGDQWVEVSYEAPRPVVEQFLTQCRRTGLDPFARQIYCIERGGKWGIQASIDGFRLVAERTGTYRGQTPAQWCGLDGNWVEVWLKKEAPAAARIGIYRDGFTEPLWAVATYEGYCPRDRNGNLKPANQWATNPANQLAKCAEMLGLRKAFPQDLSGVYGAEEMDEATHTEAVADKPAAGRTEAVEPEPARRPAQSLPQVDEAAVAKWNEWKEAIDAAPDRRALAALWEQAKLIANNPIPGDVEGRRVGDYFSAVGRLLPDEVDEATGEVVSEKDADVQAEVEPVTEWAVATIPDDDTAAEGNADAPF